MEGWRYLGGDTEIFAYSHTRKHTKCTYMCNRIHTHQHSLVPFIPSLILLLTPHSPPHSPPSPQARCRGYLVRREFHRKLWAVTKIQAQVRGLIARRQYRKLKLRVEAARLKEEEERALRKQMDKRKAKEIAEKKYKVRALEDFISCFGNDVSPGAIRMNARFETFC